MELIALNLDESDQYIICIHNIEEVIYLIDKQGRHKRDDQILSGINQGSQRSWMVLLYHFDFYRGVTKDCVLFKLDRLKHKNRITVIYTEYIGRTVCICPCNKKIVDYLNHKKKILSLR